MNSAKIQKYSLEVLIPDSVAHLVSHDKGYFSPLPVSDYFDISLRKKR